MSPCRRALRPRRLAWAFTAVLSSSCPALGSGAPPPQPLVIAGIVVPMVTPFDATGEHVDLAAMQAHVRWLLDKPVNLLFPISGLGQWRRLSLAEKQEIIRAVVQAAAGRLPVAPGVTSQTSLAETLALARFAAENGAAALTVAVPDYLVPAKGRPTQAVLYEFYKAVHDGTQLPVLIYDAVADLEPETGARLAALPRIRAIKYRTKDIERFLRMVHATAGRINVLAGVEHEGVAALAAGAAGFVGGGANIFPQLLAAVLHRFQGGDIAGSRTATFALIDANDGVPGGQEIKYALAKYYGLPLGRGVRAIAYEPLTIGEKDDVDTAVRRADPSLTVPPTALGRLAAAGVAKRDRYAALAAAATDADGFVHNKCDGVTFTALSCVARGLPQAQCPAYKAEDAGDPGRWYRHAQHDCFQGTGETGGSRSDNSPDVFTALALMFWHYRDLGAVSRVIAYGERHDWVMGRARKDVEKATVEWDEDLRALYYELLFRLGGPDHAERLALSRKPTMGDGWASHIAANRLLLVALMTEDTTADERSALTALAAREPHNGLFQALAARLADGDEQLAWQALLDERHFPATALPDNHANHCEEYLYQRDERDDGGPNANWLPCPQTARRVHSGTDLLWTACVLTPGCLKTSAVPQH